MIFSTEQVCRELACGYRFRDDNSKLLGMFDVFEQGLNKKYKSVLKNTPTVNQQGDIVEDEEDTP